MLEELYLRFWEFGWVDRVFAIVGFGQMVVLYGWRFWEGFEVFDVWWMDGWMMENEWWWMSNDGEG